MFRLSIRSLLAHKLRMAMSVVAVVLGVAFVAGTLVFTNSLSTSLDDLVSGGATDVSVTPKSAVDGSAPAADAVLTVPRRDPGEDRGSRRRGRGRRIGDRAGRLRGGRRRQGRREGVHRRRRHRLDRRRASPASSTPGTAPAAENQVVIDDTTAAAASLSVGDR